MDDDAQRSEAAVVDNPSSSGSYDIVPEPEPPESFMLLLDIFRLFAVASVKWLEYIYWGPQPRARGDSCGLEYSYSVPRRWTVDHKAHRYPYCLVWTPIPVVTWIAPYVGHVGLCDSQGQILDFTGKVRRDRMAFGWPVRYLRVDPAPGVDWEASLQAVARQYRHVDYNILTWNCHSFLASFLNVIAWHRDPLARLLGGWTVSAVGLRIFVRGRYLGAGWLRHWRGAGGLWAAVLLASCWEGEWIVSAWLRFVIGFNLSLVGWFGFASLWWVRDSQLGKMPARRAHAGAASTGGAAGDPPADGADERLLDESSSGEEDDDSESDWHPAM